MTTIQTALITGASKGLGFSLAETLARKGWRLLIDARHSSPLLKAKDRLTRLTEAFAIPGDICDAQHLAKLVQMLEQRNWQLDLVVNNASSLGISPMPNLLDYPLEHLHAVFQTNVMAPIGLLQKVWPYLKANAKIINISSDAAAEAYPTWGAYGSSKAALDQMTAILAKENPAYGLYAFDPGDMRTDMHQAVFPGEDISDRPWPSEHAVPALIELIEREFPNGRYTIKSIKQKTQ